MHAAVAAYTAFLAARDRAEQTAGLYLVRLAEEGLRGEALAARSPKGPDHGPVALVALCRRVSAERRALRDEA